MKENANKHIDSFTKKLFKDASMESPSFDFTANIMSQVNALSATNVTVYKPLISKRTWILISIAVLALIAYFIFGSQLESSGWFSTIDFTVVSENKFTEALSGFKMSKTLMYTIVFLGLMVCVQITYLKHNFDKRFEI
ncbi:hypothetical protein A9Q87_00320 [Flavobacteriales bacterium 34_180_T64]|nr:hypothetical protein A9Q87_00320 [Flavobacteriales bacterium 34_180_T64]